MQTRLFHTIVLCGAALGAVACSGNDGDDQGKEQGNATHCPPTTAEGAGGAAGASDAAATAAGGSAAVAGDGAVAGSGALTPCGGWPPTK